MKKTKADLEAENEDLRRQVFRAESVIIEYRQDADRLGFELKKLRAELKLQQQLNQPTHRLVGGFSS